MKDRKEKLMELLIHSLDNELTLDEHQALDLAFAKSKEFRAERDRLLKLRSLLNQQRTIASNEFVNAVLGKTTTPVINPVQGFNTTMVRLFPRVAAACVIIMLASLFTVYLAEGELSSDTIVGLSDISPDEAYNILIEE
jgi:hypothetical protein